MAQLSTQQAVAAALNQHVQRKIIKVQEDMTEEFTRRYRKALVQIVTEFSVNIADYYEMETQAQHVIVTLTVPVREDEQQDEQPPVDKDRLGYT